MEIIIKRICFTFALMVLVLTGCGDATHELVTLQFPQDFAVESELKEIELIVSGPGMEPIHISEPFTSILDHTFDLWVPVGVDRLFAVTVTRERDTDPFPNLDTQNTLQTGHFGSATSDVIVDEDNIVPITLRPLNFIDDLVGDVLASAPDIDNVEWYTQKGAPFCGSIDEINDNVLILIKLSDESSSPFEAWIPIDQDDDSMTGSDDPFDDAELAIHLAVGTAPNKPEVIDLTNDTQIGISSDSIQQTYDVAHGILTVCIARTNFLEKIDDDGVGSFNVLTQSLESSSQDIAHEVQNALFDLNFRRP